MKAKRINSFREGSSTSFVSANNIFSSTCQNLFPNSFEAFAFEALFRLVVDSIAFKSKKQHGTLQYWLLIRGLYNCVFQRYPFIPLAAVKSKFCWNHFLSRFSKHFFYCFCVKKCVTSNSKNNFLLGKVSAPWQIDTKLEVDENFGK